MLQDDLGCATQYGALARGSPLAHHHALGLEAPLSGGGAVLLGRLLAEEFGRNLREQAAVVVVENLVFAVLFKFLRVGLLQRFSVGRLRGDAVLNGVCGLLSHVHMALQEHLLDGRVLAVAALAQAGGPFLCTEAALRYERRNQRTLRLHLWVGFLLHHLLPARQVLH